MNRPAGFLFLAAEPGNSAAIERGHARRGQPKAGKVAGPVSPVFAPDPLGALALAEALGGMARALNWTAPEWAAGLRFARAVLANRGPELAVPLLAWPTHRLGQCRVRGGYYRRPDEGVIGVFVRLYVPSGRLRGSVSLQRRVQGGGEGAVLTALPGRPPRIPKWGERRPFILAVEAREEGPWGAELLALVEEFGLKEKGAEEW